MINDVWAWCGVTPAVNFLKDGHSWNSELVYKSTSIRTMELEEQGRRRKVPFPPLPQPLS